MACLLQAVMFGVWAVEFFGICLLIITVSLKLRLVRSRLASAPRSDIICNAVVKVPALHGRSCAMLTISKAHPMSSLPSNDCNCLKLTSMPTATELLTLTPDLTVAACLQSKETFIKHPDIQVHAQHCALLIQRFSRIIPLCTDTL